MAMLHLFEATPRRNRLERAAKAVGVNLAAAAACAILAFLDFGVAFAAEESGHPLPVSVLAFLWATVLGVAALGCWGGWRWSRLPWLVVALTPLLMTAVFWRFGDPPLAFRFGGSASIVFFVGALVRPRRRALD